MTRSRKPDMKDPDPQSWEWLERKWGKAGGTLVLELMMKSKNICGKTAFIEHGSLSFLASRLRVSMKNGCVVANRGYDLFLFADHVRGPQLPKFLRTKVRL